MEWIFSFTTHSFCMARAVVAECLLPGQEQKQHDSYRNVPSHTSHGKNAYCRFREKIVQPWESLKYLKPLAVVATTTTIITIRMTCFQMLLLFLHQEDQDNVLHCHWETIPVAVSQFELAAWSCCLILWSWTWTTERKNTTSNHFSKADNTSETTMALTSLGYRKDKVNVDQLDWATDNTNNNHKPLSSSSVDNDMKEFLVNPLSKVRSSSISSLNVWAPSNNNNYQQDWFTESASMVVSMPTCISPMHLTFMSQEQQTHWAWQLMIIIWPFKLVQLLMF